MDVHIVCRGCLTNTDAIDHFKLEEIGLNDQTYQEMLEEVSGFTVRPDIEPNRLCENCGVILLELYKFKQTLQETQNILEHLKKPINNETSSMVVDVEISSDEEEAATQMSLEMSEIEEEFLDEKDEEVKENYLNERYSEETFTGEPSIKVESIKLDQTIEELMTKEEPPILDDHMLACTYCSKIYSSYYILCKHFRSKHPLVQPEHGCQFCGKKYFMKEWMERHQRHCHGQKVKRTTCKYCGVKFGTYRKMRQHVNKNHAEEDTMTPTVLIKCPFCSARYRNYKQVWEHFAESHPDRRTLKCDYCEALTWTPQLIQKHLNTCPGYIEHNKNIEFVCPYCPTVKRGKMKLENHIQAVHLRWSNKQTYQCDICKKFLKTKHSLHSHMRIVHLPKSMYKCPDCGDCYKSQSGYKYHIAQKHSQTQSFYCHICDFVTTQNFLLRLHIKRHIGEKTHNCTECTKTFTTLDGLKSHLVFSHSDERPFKCKTCAKAYKTRQKLREHQRVHGDEFEYHCSYCENTFSFNRDLQQHIKSCHPEKMCNMDA